MSFSLVLTATDERTLRAFCLDYGSVQALRHVSLGTRSGTRAPRGMHKRVSIRFLIGRRVSEINRASAADLFAAVFSPYKHKESERFPMHTVRSIDVLASLLRCPHYLVIRGGLLMAAWNGHRGRGSEGMAGVLVVQA